MNAIEIVEAQRKDWNRVASAWEKWDAQLDQSWSFVNYLVVGYARVRPGIKALDLGCGTGHPAFLGAVAVGHEGELVGVDLAEKMVESANKKAQSLGLSNLRFETGDAAHLQFQDGEFDSVISRFCFMFVPEIERGLSEVSRVLKPASYFSAAVWSAPEKNPHLRLPMDALKKFIPLPVPGPNDPSLFRFAKPGVLAELAQKAGFDEVTDYEVTGYAYKDSPEEYFTNLMEIAAPLQGLFAKLTPQQAREAEADIKKAAENYRTNGKLAMPFAVRIVSGRKPPK